MFWKKKISLEKLRKKAERTVVTDVKRTLDKVRDEIFADSKKIGGWETYINNLQKGLHFASK